MSRDQGATPLKMWESSPPESSLHELIIENSWLIDHPLCWTAKHLQILHCAFHDIDVLPGAETQTQTTLPDADAVRFAKMLANHRTPLKKYMAAIELLCSEGSPLEQVRSDAPSFIFNGRRVRIPDCEVFCPTTTTTSPAANHSTSPLVIGYLHYDLVMTAREKKFKAGVYFEGGWNHNMLQKKLEKCKPEIWTRDPYLVCVMLSLAQLRRRDLYPSLPANYEVRLLTSKKGDTTHAHVFDAEFHISVLDELDGPSEYVKATWPTIYHTRVPYEPYDTFASRITAHLARDIYVEPKIMFKNETPSMWTQTLVMMDSK
ncbi:hypothetical protein FPSE_10529 [Fusarium pseudograminearum CS3096]|uniref:Uncharacterized protein n=1 Tax=Fusarium pseudograminearum (strain CS3096) TaxID=1028729 RepID=K3UCS9_FUSPC|nr:hypothetical protein FPSE_10529 [Fusarium pseudograminearum CS3096]EKJ69276.1 hypothetical protein FPSE_10529 [Fusarium pseudograminearum CS3096]KAF0638586.1 hypothetical protein FPSE5266_10529 [Fusarium pseudograminearum]